MFCFQFDWIKPDVICTMYSESNMMNGIGQRNMQSFHFKYAYRDVLLTLMGVNSRRIVGRKLFFLDIIELCILNVMIISTTHSKINNLLNLPYLTFLHSWLICGTIDLKSCIINKNLVWFVFINNALFWYRSWRLKYLQTISTNDDPESNLNANFLCQLLTTSLKPHHVA